METFERDDWEHLVMFLAGVWLGYCIVVGLGWLITESIVALGEYQQRMIREVYADIAAEQRISHDIRPKAN